MLNCGIRLYTGECDGLRASETAAVQERPLLKHDGHIFFIASPSWRGICSFDVCVSCAYLDSMTSRISTTTILYHMYSAAGLIMKPSVDYEKKETFIIRSAQQREESF